jgi:hypothetical protein
LTFVPAEGFSLMTLPEGTVVLDAVVTVPSTSPAAVMADVAAVCVCPTTLGTATPVEITRLTADPPLTAVPAVGLSLITLPTGTVMLEALLVVTVSPTLVMADAAAACVCPTTLGTATPVEITRLTADPLLTDVPADGLSLITLPTGTVLLEADVTVPSTRPAPVMADVAAACVCPTTPGTATPVEITRLTADPPLTDVPADGLSLITLPIGTVLLDALLVVTVRPAPVMADVAAACVCPTTLGTLTPVEITRLTAVPPLTCVPATGLSLMTLPTGTVLLEVDVTVPNTSPTAVMADVAVA